jgi:hypothetical protein
MYCYTLLPLDLHVLGLPLALILSQDQTLHCMFEFILTSCIPALVKKLHFGIDF